jgi:glycosyltransferase involved in cell wall biosynthesis
VEDGKSGIVVASGDYEMMSQTIIRLLTDREKVADMGKSGKLRVSTEFGWGNVVSRYEAVFDAITISPRRSRQALRLEGQGRKNN